MKKTFVKTAAAVISVCMLAACGGDSGVPENITADTNTTTSTAAVTSESAQTSERQTTSASESTETTESQTEETSEAEETASNSEYMDNIKNIFAGRDDTPLYYQAAAADITGDGFPELFVYCTATGQTGYMDIYDVMDGGVNLGTIKCKSANGDVYADENGEYHLIVCDDYFFSTNTQYTAYLDLHFSGGKLEITVPLLSVVYSWFEDSGEHCFVDRYYRDCEYAGSYDPDDVEFFDLEKNEHHYCGYTMYEDNFIIQAEFEERETEEIAKIIDENVYDGLTKQYEVDIITSSMNWISPNDFYEFAEEYLKEIYAD